MGNIKKNVLDFEILLSRIKTILNTESDKAVAIAIDMKPNAFYNRKKKNSVPLSEFVCLANTHNVSADWLINGEGPIYKGTTPESDHQSAASEKDVSHDAPVDQPTITELITKTIEILESETVYSNALSANIQAFHYATGAEQRFRELQDSTNKRFKKMEGRIAAQDDEINKLQEQIKNIPPGDCTMAANQG